MEKVVDFSRDIKRRRMQRAFNKKERFHDGTSVRSKTAGTGQPRNVTFVQGLEVRNKVNLARLAPF